MLSKRPFLFAIPILCAACSQRPVVPVAQEEKAPSKVQELERTPQPILPGLPAETIVLTYHDVIQSRDQGSVWFDTTTDELRDQIDWLAGKGATFITLDQLYSHLTEGTPLPSHPIAITFADNYLGFYRRALPILRERKIPAAMFVHTGFVGSKVGRPKMNWDQLVELDREGLVTIASQTVSHPPDLRALTDELLTKEIVNSKRVLEDRLGHEVRYLAYPNGKFDNRAQSIAKFAGYWMAFSEAQMPAEKSSSIYAVARYVHTKYRKAWNDAN